jgi:hypothetical protein
VVKHENLENSVALYGLAALGFGLGFVGRTRELREVTEDMAKNGQRSEKQLSKATQIQIVVIAMIVGICGTWFTLGN